MRQRSKCTTCRARFGHLVGYGGMYYSYLYATALAAALWRAHFAADPLSREAGAPAAASTRPTLSAPRACVHGPLVVHVQLQIGGPLCEQAL